MAAHLGKHQAAQTWPARQSGTLLGNVTCTHACAGSSKIEMGFGAGSGYRVWIDGPHVFCEHVFLKTKHMCSTYGRRGEGYRGVIMPKYRLVTISTYRHINYAKDPQRRVHSRRKEARAMGPGHTGPLVSSLLFLFFSPLTVRAWGHSQGLTGQGRTYSTVVKGRSPQRIPPGPRTETSHLRAVKLLCRCGMFCGQPGRARGSWTPHRARLVIPALHPPRGRRCKPDGV